jgi:hypothetical protein
MDPDFVRWCAEQMNKLPFVRWDRCVMRPGGGVAYGWIDRDDGRCDFVVIYLGERFGFCTSSAKHSREISLLLLGTDEGHRDCERVAGVFGDQVANKVTLPQGTERPR